MCVCVCVCSLTGVIKTAVPVISFQSNGPDSALHFLCRDGDPTKPRCNGVQSHFPSTAFSCAAFQFAYLLAYYALKVYTFYEGKGTQFFSFFIVLKRNEEAH